MSLSIAERQLIELRIRNDGPNIAVAYVLWAVLGLPVSAHRFYLGRPRSAIYQIISVFLLVGVFWWLLDAALISGIIRDQKEAMRQDLIREIEEGREVEAAPAPRRFVADPDPILARAPDPAPEPVRAAPAVTAPEPAPPEPAPPPLAAEPDVVMTRSKPQPFGLQSLGDEPAPPPVVEPVMLRPAPEPEPFGRQSIADETSRPPAIAEPVTEAGATVAPAETETRPFGFRLTAPEPGQPVAEAPAAEPAAEPVAPPAPGEPGSGTVHSDTVIRFPPDS
jgi:hypothetical protein